MKHVLTVLVGRTIGYFTNNTDMKNVVSPQSHPILDPSKIRFCSIKIENKKITNVQISSFVSNLQPNFHYA